MNRNAPLVYQDKGLEIYASNLCSEIASFKHRRVFCL